MAARSQRVVPTTEATDAADRIAGRRRIAEDPDLPAFDHAPLAALEYVLTRQQVHAGVLAEDILDALILLGYVRGHVPAIPATLDGYEYQLLTTGTKVGLSLSTMAVPLGLRSRQAVEHRILRYESGQRGGPRHEAAERAARKSETAQRSWCNRHGPRLVAAATLLLDHHGKFRDAGLDEDLDELADTLTAVPNPNDGGYMQALGYLASRIRLLSAEVTLWETETYGTAGTSPLTVVIAAAGTLAVQHGRLLSS